MCDMEAAKVGRLRCSSLDKKLRKRLQVMDYLLALFVFAPLCILYWRGTYQLAAFYVLPTNPVLSATLSSLLGCVVQVCMSVAQGPLTRLVEPLPAWIRFVVTRGYTALYALGLVNHWRGVWELLDVLTTTSLWSSCGSTLAGGIALVALRSLRNVLAPPLVVNLDLPEDYFVVPTFFKCHTCGGNVPKAVGLVGDAVFSVVMVGTLVIFIWRGVWTVLDTHFLTASLIASAAASIFVGYLMTVTVLIFQKPASSLAAHLQASHRPLLRLLFEDLFMLFGSVGSIFVWRGIWMLADEFILTDNFELSNWVCHILGLVGLIISYNSNTLLSRGVYIDGDLPNGQGCIFPIDYLTILYDIRNSSSDEVVLQPVPLVAVTDSKINGQPFLHDDTSIPFIDDEKLSNNYKEG